MVAVFGDLMALCAFKASHDFIHLCELLTCSFDHVCFICADCVVYLIETICVCLAVLHLLLEFVLAEDQCLAICGEFL